MSAVSEYPLANPLNGTEKLLGVQNGVTVLVQVSAAAMAPTVPPLPNAGNPLEQARTLKRDALIAWAARQRQIASTQRLSCIVGLAGAMQNPDLIASFDAKDTSIADRLTTGLAAVDAAATVEAVNAVVW